MPDAPRLTLSVITADVGGFIGHVSSHPEVLDTAKERLHNAREKGSIADFHVLRCGDDLGLVVTHGNGPSSASFHELAWNILEACRDVARELKLYATEAGLKEGVFSGNLVGMGPGVAEMEFAERESEPVVVFMANKASVGSWNLPLFRTFADPFNTVGLILDPAMMEGFTFRVVETASGAEVSLSSPVESHYLLSLIGSTARYALASVHRNSDGAAVASVSAPKLSFCPGRPPSRSEPSVILRCQGGFPAVGEVMEAFSFPHLVGGWMRGAHIGPLMPVPFYEANPTRFDGPPRLIAAGFQIANGRLIGPHDMFDDPSFDETRRLANQTAEFMRRHGPFGPHMLTEAEEGSVAMLHVLDRLKARFKSP
jgi:fructose 1,6-bisphosphate aldolase/phosphatase